MSPLLAVVAPFLPHVRQGQGCSKQECRGTGLGAHSAGGAAGCRLRCNRAQQGAAWRRFRCSRAQARVQQGADSGVAGGRLGCSRA
ncbi:hypothetical protein SLEP1_g41052 [Rubroshorea leprosula]|uniref:Uncharacterized protein n=1 Tax=Rubroshorea leprosula TaxID=152421 RepID=A0AAV5L5A2_9ROSI|nr:hypothetical protein SLEP1_g41052 [Rubroshorea leprosula]